MQCLKKKKKILFYFFIFNNNKKKSNIFRWLTSSWTDCSTSCGIGYQIRDVFCVEVHYNNFSTNNNKTQKNFDTIELNEIDKRKVTDQYCWQIQKPVIFLFKIKIFI